MRAFQIDAIIPAKGTMPSMRSERRSSRSAASPASTAMPRGIRSSLFARGCGGDHVQASNPPGDGGQPGRSPPCQALRFLADADANGPEDRGAHGADQDHIPDVSHKGSVRERAVIDPGPCADQNRIVF